MAVSVSGDPLARLIGQYSDWRWRLHNLYWITNKDGKRVKFQPTWAQMELFDNLHYQNLILKARQLGFTTFIEILMLDRILFNSNTRCGTIAHTLTDAMAIFADKVKYPYGQLPEQIRAARPSMKDSATELLLSNNSSIRVGTSLRSGTMQILHISEYGKICAKYPHKAREVRTGALNTVQAGQLIFIESTAEGQAGHFYEMSQEARAKLRTAEKLSTLDYRFHFFPWWKEPTYVLDPEGVVIADGYVRYFRDLEHRHGIVLRPEQQAWYAKKADVQRGDMKREFPSTPDEAFEAAVEGAYYANEMAKAELDGRIGSFPHVPGLRVHTAWDIGRDTTSIWFFQVVLGRLRILRYYGTSGEGLPHFLKELRRLEAVEGYSYGTHFLPHDMRVKEWGSDKTRIEQMIAGGFIPQIATAASIDDGIEAVRGTLPLCEFDHGPTADGTKALKAYRKTWNEDRASWSDTPYHDWASHPADSFRYLSLSWRAVKETLAPEPYIEPTEPLINTVTVDRWHEIKPTTKRSIRV